MSETDTERQRSDDYDDLTAEHVASFAEDKFDRRASKLVYGICAGEKSNGTVGRVTASGNRDRLKTEYGVEYDDLAEEARNWKPELDSETALSMLEGHEGDVATRSREQWEERAEESDESTTDTAGSDEFRRKVRERLSGRCGMLADEWLDTMQNMADAVEEHGDLNPEDIVMCRKADAEAGARLRENLTREAGIPAEEARELSIGTLTDLVGDGDDGDSLSPAPRSGDMQSPDTTRYSDPETAEELKQRIAYIENNSSGGELMEAQKELYQEKLAELEA